ncbi:hypothetical protein CCAX7_40500 [Capsulimonas corticalis]|uniref:Uncharacterized protein n=1 Tax=Capsulimonas corticalis TaxID=2219043 RepID=A0A402D4Y8_9BACT|nr:HEAT repeat domain-containing protein [Capsulimonas corticalis]BDI31999.1 hypothetical protein CCAX7_40500 [Capsulimonas corticalis]
MHGLPSARQEKSAFQKLRHSIEVKRIAGRSAALAEALQNYPLQKLLAQAKGRVVETARVRPLEERASREARAQIIALTQIAESISDKPARAVLFRTVLPIFGEALGFQGGEWSVCKATVRALGTIWGDDKIVSLLAYITENHKDIVVSRAAATQLAKIGGAEAFRALTNALGHRDRDVQRIAEQTLELRSNYSFAVAALENGLKHVSPEVRRRSANVLDRLSWKPGAPEMEGWRMAARQDWEGAVSAGAASIPALEGAMKGKDARVREQAAKSLEAMAWRPRQYAMTAWYHAARRDWDAAAELKISATAALANALDDEDETVSDPAGACLARIGAYSVPTLACSLRDSWDVRMQQRASHALTVIARNTQERGNPQVTSLYIDAVPALTEALADGHNQVLLEPGYALAEISEHVFDSTQVFAVFEDSIDRIREVVSAQHPIVRKELEECLRRIQASANAGAPGGSRYIGLGDRSGSRK